MLFTNIPVFSFVDLSCSYCSNGGMCKISADNKLFCSCLPGFLGSRCEEKGKSIVEHLKLASSLL